jgi:hypothetical protein
MGEKATFVESLVMVECKDSKKVVKNIIEMLDGESLDTLRRMEKVLLDSILSGNDEKKNVI